MKQIPGEVIPSLVIQGFFSFFDNQLVLCVFFAIPLICGLHEILNEMKLEDFISESIIQIITGVKKAQDFANKNQAIINPASIRLSNASGNAYYDGDTLRPAQIIEFDISVTTKEDGQISGKAGIFISAFKIGIEGKGGDENLISNRIKFEVPIMLPTQIKETNG